MLGYIFTKGNSMGSRFFILTLLLIGSVNYLKGMGGTGLFKVGSIDSFKKIIGEFEAGKYDDNGKEISWDFVNKTFLATRDTFGNNILHRIIMYYNYKKNNLTEKRKNALLHFLTLILEKKTGNLLLDSENNEKEKPLTLALHYSADVTKLFLDKVGAHNSGLDRTEIFLNGMFNFGEGIIHTKEMTKDVVDTVLERTDINWEGTLKDFGSTILHISAQTDLLRPFLKSFLEKKQKVAEKLINIKDKIFEKTPLHYAATPEQVTDLLGVPGVDVNEEDFDKKTPLQLFIQGADLDVEAFDKKTPSHSFIQIKRADLVEALLASNKVNVTKKMKVDGEDIDPFVYAQKKLATSDKWEKIKKRMIELGATPKEDYEPVAIEVVLNRFAQQLFTIVHETPNV